jgi:NifU-like protein
MAAPVDARRAGERVEALLAQLGDEPRAARVAEDLVRCLVDFYGAGLARVAQLVGPATLAELARDPLVESLLLIHDLHPLDPDARVRQALDRLPAEGVEYLGIDADGVVRLRISASGHGCGSSTAAVRQAVEQAIGDAVPEATGIDVQAVPAPPPLLQIGRRR